MGSRLTPGLPYPDMQEDPAYAESTLPPTEVVTPPVNRRQEMLDMLMARAKAPVDTAALAAEQESERQRQMALGIIEGTTHMAKGYAGAASPTDMTSAKEASRAQLNNYLALKKAERDQSDASFKSLQEMADFEQLQAKSDAAQKAGLTPRRVDTWIGEKGEPLYEVPGKPGFVTSDLQSYTGKPKSFKQEGVNIQLGGLEERKKSGERSEQRFAWNKDTKMIDRIGDLGKELNKAGESQYTMYRDDVLSNMKSAESAYGPIDSLKTDWMLSPEGQKFRGSVARLIAPLRKDLFGATLTGNEQSAFDTMVGTGKGMSMSTFKNALNKLIEAKDKQINSIKSYDPAATQVYEQQRSGGFVKAPESGAAPVKKKRKFNTSTGQWET